jgi:hypothetical protein
VAVTLSAAVSLTSFSKRITFSFFFGALFVGSGIEEYIPGKYNRQKEKVELD